MRVFNILSPRWRDRRVLLSCGKVRDHNKILFTGRDGASMGVDPYYIDGKSVKKFKKDSNGVIMCYSIPLDQLSSLELQSPCEHDWS